MSIRDIFKVNFKKYRNQAELTQEKLAEICDTNACYIRQIENGSRFPSIDYIEKFASALNIMPFVFFYEESEAEAVKLRLILNSQKEKIKLLLVENTSKICTIIDEC